MNMREELQKLFDDAFSNFQASELPEEGFHQGQMVAYDTCLKLFDKHNEYLYEELKKFNQGFSYKPPQKE